MPWRPQILADQLTISQPGGANYARHITTGTLGFADLLRPCNDKKTGRGEGIEPIKIKRVLTYVQSLFRM